MTEYIDREAAIKAMDEDRKNYHGFMAEEQFIHEDAIEVLKKIPAADVRPVLRGKWNRTDAYPHRLYCSVCYKTYLKNDELLERWEFPLNFCPNCGADTRNAND